jgi:hypothetical protein
VETEDYASLRRELGIGVPGSRIEQFNAAMQAWLAEQREKAQVQAGGQSRIDAIKEWYYGPKSVKTIPITMPKATAPTPKANAPKGPAHTGREVPPQQSLILIPNKKPEGVPAFGGEVIGAPNAGGVIAPPIGGAGGAGAGGARVVPGGAGGVPRVVDPTSPTGYKYLTPDEIQQRQPIVAPVEDSQPVE